MNLNEVLEQLKNENCIIDGKLLKWPKWLEWETVQAMVTAGILVKKFYKNLNGHTDYILK